MTIRTNLETWLIAQINRKTLTLRGFNRVAPRSVFSAKAVELQYGARLNGRAAFRGMGTVTIGRYAAIGQNLTVLTSNHSVNMLNVNAALQSSISRIPNRDKGKTVAIGAASWIGDNVTIIGASVGIGAVIGAGSVVTREVAPFSIVAGNPARVIRMRFPDPLREAILASHWWDLDRKALTECPKIFEMDLSKEPENDTLKALNLFTAPPVSA